VILTFGWALFVDGLWHLEFNASMRIHGRILLPVFGNKLASIFGRFSQSAVDNFYRAVSHHKGNSTLEVLYIAGKFCLVKTFLKASPEPHTAETYTKWVQEKVKNEYFHFLNQLIFGCLESYFTFKEGVRYNDVDMLMSGLLELEKIFFLKKSNRNYQAAAAYRASDMITMDQEMQKIHLGHQVTRATVYNSFNLPHTSLHEGESDLMEDIVEKTGSKFEETAAMKQKAPQGQGCDAAMEQLIKRSKKGAKIQWLEERGWNQEFRCMATNVLISKKVERDVGSSRRGGVHLRKNLKEIIAVEALIESEGWLEEPETLKHLETNMDETANLNSEVAAFWFCCGQNRDKGIDSILRDEPVMFKDFLVTDKETDTGNTDLKSMIKDLPEMIKAIPEDNPLKSYFSNLFTSEIVGSKNLDRVTEFFSLVAQILQDSVPSDDFVETDSESDEI